MKTYYMGIDVSKGYSDFVVLDKDKKAVLPSFKLDDTYENHVKLVNKIKSITHNNEIQLTCGLESTGGYENNWYNTILKETQFGNVKVTRINPFRVYFSKKVDLTKTSTDRISAEHIARFMINHNEKLYFNQTDLYSTEKKLYQYHQTISKQGSALKNQLQQILYNSFPELVKFMIKGLSNWFLQFLIKYPLPSSLKNVNKNNVINGIPYIKKEYVDYIFKMSQKSVASSDDTIIADITRKLADKILKINKEKCEIIKILSRRVDKNLFDLLRTIPGIGKQTATVILLLIGDISRFNDAKKMCSLFGLVPVYSQSGDSVKGSKISKKGNKLMRSTLFMAAKSAIRHPYFKELFNFYKTKNDNYYFAITCIMHKMLRIVYGMLKSNKSFDVKIDRSYRNYSNANKRKHIHQQSVIGISEDAPVSYRESIKRKQEPSQNFKFDTGSGSHSLLDGLNINHQSKISQKK